MAQSNVRYFSYPKTEVPPPFAKKIAEVFEKHEPTIGTEKLEDGLKSNAVLETVREDLVEIGFEVESGKSQDDIIERPVLFGEGGEPELQYEVDGYHSDWRCGLEVEAGRAWKGNAVYRDLIQALVMVQVDTLALAVPNVYKYGEGNKYSNYAFDKTKSVVDTLFATHRFESPYNLILIGY